MIERSHEVEDEPAGTAAPERGAPLDERVDGMDRVHRRPLGHAEARLHPIELGLDVRDAVAQHHVGPHAGERRDLAHVASDVGAVPREHLELVPDHLRGAMPVPVVRVPRDGTERLLLAPTTDE